MNTSKFISLLSQANFHYNIRIGINYIYIFNGEREVVATVLKEKLGSMNTNFSAYDKLNNQEKRFLLNTITDYVKNYEES